MSPSELASKIDHTLLKPEATPAMIDRLCDEAMQYGFAAVCVNPIWVARCADRLSKPPPSEPASARPVNSIQVKSPLSSIIKPAVRIASVVGFPLGANQTAVKVDEAKRVIDDGADEIDMVIRLGDLVAGNTAIVRDDIAAVAEAVHAASAAHLLKVILETAVLTREQIITACQCALQAGADFVKTSTGFHPAGGATIEAVRLLREHAWPLKVKAAGGIRDAATALAMIEAGADRLGCSASVQIISERSQNA